MALLSLVGGLLLVLAILWLLLVSRPEPAARASRSVQEVKDIERATIQSLLATERAAQDAAADLGRRGDGDGPEHHMPRNP